MLIKDIYKFCKSFYIVNESMSIGDFKNSTKNGQYDKTALNEALFIWRNYKKFNFKEEYSLEKYIKCPSVLIHDIISKFISLYEKERILGKKTDYEIVKETEDWVLINAKNIESFKYISHSYLRQKDDKEDFGSGPTWCIASSSAKRYWNNYCGCPNSPLAYILLSKHDSKSRYAIVLDEIIEKLSSNNIKPSSEILRDEVIENINDGASLEYMSNEIRDFDNEDYSSDISDLLEEKFDTTEREILDSILDYVENEFEIDEFEISENGDSYDDLYSKYSKYFTEEHFNLLDIVIRKFASDGFSSKDIPWAFVLFNLQNENEDTSMWNLKKDFKQSYSKMVDGWNSSKNITNPQQIFYETLYMILIQYPNNYSEEILSFVKMADYLGLSFDVIEKNIKSIKSNKQLEKIALKDSYKNQLIDKYNFNEIINILDENQSIKNYFKEFLNNLSLKEMTTSAKDFCDEFEKVSYDNNFNGIGTDSMSKVVQNFLNDYAEESSKGEDYIYDIINYDLESKDYIYLTKHLSSWLFTFRKTFDIKKLASWCKTVLKSKKEYNISTKMILISVILGVELADIRDGNVLKEKYKEILEEYSLEMLYNVPAKIANMPLVKYNLRQYDLQSKLTYLVKKIENESYENILKKMDFKSIIKDICEKIDLFITNRKPETEIIFSTNDWLRLISDIFREINSSKRLYKKYGKDYSGNEIKMSRIVIDEMMSHFKYYDLENLDYALSTMYQNPSFVYSKLLEWTW